MNCNDRRATITYREDYDEEEVDVGDVVELKPQVLRNESQRRILGSPDFVPGELSKGTTFSIPRIGRQWDIEEYPSPCIFGLAAFSPRIGLLLYTLEMWNNWKTARTGRLPFLLARACFSVMKAVYNTVPLFLLFVPSYSLGSPPNPLDRVRDVAVFLVWLDHHHGSAAQCSSRSSSKSREASRSTGAPLKLLQQVIFQSL